MEAVTVVTTTTSSVISPSIVTHRASSSSYRLRLYHPPPPPRSFCRIFPVHRNQSSFSSSSGLFPFPVINNNSNKRWWRNVVSSSSSSSSSGGDEEMTNSEAEEGDEEEEEVERALGLDGSIPSSSQEFVRRVSSRAYDMRRHLMQSIDSSSYDVLETNPWREDSKPVYVLADKDNQLWTMKTRCTRSEVENELGLLFSKGRRQELGIGNNPKQSKASTNFHMLVEDIREGVLVFEDEHDATRYCDLLEGGGKGCEGIAELEASSVFDICRRMRALAVLFRRGRTPPLPKSLEQNLRARKRSLEDQDIA